MDFPTGNVALAFHRYFAVTSTASVYKSRSNALQLLATDFNFHNSDHLDILFAKEPELATYLGDVFSAGHFKLLAGAKAITVTVKPIVSEEAARMADILKKSARRRHQVIEKDDGTVHQTFGIGFAPNRVVPNNNNSPQRFVESFKTAQYNAKTFAFKRYAEDGKVTDVRRTIFSHKSKKVLGVTREPVFSENVIHLVKMDSTDFFAQLKRCIRERQRVVSGIDFIFHVLQTKAPSLMRAVLTDQALDVIKEEFDTLVAKQGLLRGMSPVRNHQQLIALGVFMHHASPPDDIQSCLYQTRGTSKLNFYLFIYNSNSSLFADILDSKQFIVVNGTRFTLETPKEKQSLVINVSENEDEVEE